MEPADYFEKAKGTGVLGTVDSEGHVDMAIYAKPHVVDPTTVAFVMRQRLSHQNLKSTMHAAYLFIEDGPGYKGCRLYLTKLREEINASLAAAIREKQPAIYPEADDSNKYVVIFKVDRIRPLIGDEPPCE
ncbi:MAG: pyridoxamine 5'-phosphate oxidase family protein [Sedimentisphaerales bacterium]|nr:pyridoxamine 5'-phosphate oxidase family protein [Sedimentisphaerales bacterium]